MAGHVLEWNINTVISRWSWLINGYDLGCIGVYPPLLLQAVINFVYLLILMPDKLIYKYFLSTC